MRNKPDSTMTRRAQALHGIALLLAACLVQAEPFGYVVNSDSLSDTDFDQLYRVDLATGDATLIGSVGYGDVEGLALSPDGTLYGVDDGTETLIIIDTQTGQGSPVDNTAGNLTQGPDGLQIGASYDFGLAFDIQGRLWLTSDVTGQLWELDPQTGEPIGTAGSGDTNAIFTASGDGPKSHNASQPHVSGLAACGNSLYGVTVTSPRSLVDVLQARDIGQLMLAEPFDDAGLDFGNGQLWGIADRSAVGGNVLDEPSNIFTVDLSSGAATLVTTTIVGVESLAIAAPGPCPQDQTSSHPIPANDRAGLLLMVLCLGFGAGLALRARGTA